MRSLIAGSSPLARGLRTGALGAVGITGIIPARAGFTAYFLLRRYPAKDHPRSRGVYPNVTHFRAPFSGSSPLARGLRTLDLPRPTGYRIIPARAGFTVLETCWVGTPMDHPRSRGVYLRVPHRESAELGSSPLARGLPPRSRFRGRGRGIIPARAGFTDALHEFRGLFGDHPRSRGVYSLIITALKDAGGSSPLARGLLRGRFSLDGAPRIIPARAGFTLADPWNPNEPVLYQTPVAFTADLGPAPPSCGSAAVVLRWTTTPSGA